jgi:hypothetical protein
MYTHFPSMPDLWCCYYCWLLLFLSLDLRGWV